MKQNEVLNNNLLKYQELNHHLGQTWSLTGYVYIGGLEQEGVLNINFLTVLWLPLQCDLGVNKLDSFWMKLN